jgi:glycosyltransferase involved in cell wall biosynthesis
VTCLCLTRNRPQWLPQAIACYRLQTYASRELLILSDGVDVRGLIPDDPSIRHVHLEGAPEIGDKRNFGCHLAAGEIVAHWDDDDHSAPGRLADQVQRILDSGKPVTGYSHMRFTDGQRWWQYRGSPDYSLGTALCFRKAWWEKHPFPAKQVAEDVDFVAAARAQGAIASVEAGEMMYATIHPGNTSPRNLDCANWKAL